MEVSVSWWLEFIVGWLLQVLWVAVLYPVVWFFRSQGLTGKAASAERPSTWPPVSVVVAARNEEASIEVCLGSILEMDYPDMDVIVVDDRSEDRTGQIMESLALRDKRVRVVHIAEVPEGWLGKTNALSQGAKASGGEYILFTDGDVLFERGALRKAVAYTRHMKLDLLSLIPGTAGGGFWERALKSFFGMFYLLGTKPWAMVSGSGKGYAGVGAFNLVRRQAYEGAGGHRPIRLDVLDDLKLGKLFMRSGLRQDMLFSEGLVKVRWHVGLGGVVRGLEKNGFAGLDYSFAKLMLATAVLMVSGLLPYAGALYFEDLRALGYGLTLIVMNAAFVFASLRGAGNAAVGLAFPLILPVYLWAFWRSAIAITVRGGVQWRGSSYPLKVLKRNMYR